jgi:hypothetical protein
MHTITIATEPSPLTVPETILQQLGGKRFVTMTGAKYFTGDSPNQRLTFQLPILGPRRYFRITLTPADVYTLEYGKWNLKREFTVIETVHDVSCDNLQETFTRMTGLASHL